MIMKGKALYTIYIMIFVVLLGVYFIISGFTLLNQPINTVVRLYNTILLVLELIIAVILFGTNLGTRASFNEKLLRRETPLLKKQPVVSVIVSIFNEPIRVVKNTLVSLSQLNHYKIAP